MEAPVRIYCYFLIVLLAIFSNNVKGDITVQDDYECGSYHNPKVVRITDRDEEIITSHAGEYYASGRNCILTLVGKKDYQFELELMQIDLDLHAYTTDNCGGLCCYDYLKIFNSYRVDNARLLPDISQWGMCGNDLPLRVRFFTTQNFVTIQFKTDLRNDYKRGFTIRLNQYPWSNIGAALPDGGLYGSWNDGSKNILFVDWSDQRQIPGDYLPGKPGNDYDKEQGGSKCYECQGCDLEFFDPVQESASIKGGCYVCSKSWRDEFASAQRVCYTKLQFTNLLYTLVDSSVGGGKAEEFRSCKRFMDSYGVPLNYCICDGDLCNSAGRVNINPLALIALVLALLLKQ